MPSNPARLQMRASCPRAHPKHVAPGAMAGEGLECGKQRDRARTTRPDQGQQPSKKEGAGSTQFLPLSAREQRKGRKAKYGHGIYSLDPSSFRSNDVPVSEGRWQVCDLWHLWPCPDTSLTVRPAEVGCLGNGGLPGGLRNRAGRTQEGREAGLATMETGPVPGGEGSDDEAGPSYEPGSEGLLGSRSPSGADGRGGRKLRLYPTCPEALMGTWVPGSSG